MSMKAAALVAGLHSSAPASAASEWNSTSGSCTSSVAARQEVAASAPAEEPGALKAQAAMGMATSAWNSEVASTSGTCGGSGGRR